MLLRYSTQRQGIPLRSSTDTFICCKLPNINMFLSILTYICDFSVMSCIPVVHDVQIIMRKLLFTLYPSIPGWHVDMLVVIDDALCVDIFGLLLLFHNSDSCPVICTTMLSHLFHFILFYLHTFYFVMYKLHLHVRFSWFVFYHASLIIIQFVIDTINDNLPLHIINRHCMW